MRLAMILTAKPPTDTRHPRFASAALGPYFSAAEEAPAVAEPITTDDRGGPVTAVAWVFGREDEPP